MNRNRLAFFSCNIKDLATVTRRHTLKGDKVEGKVVSTLNASFLSKTKLHASWTVEAEKSNRVNKRLIKGTAG